jgi:hypothetical protein
MIERYDKEQGVLEDNAASKEGKASKNDKRNRRMAPRKSNDKRFTTDKHGNIQ